MDKIIHKIINEFTEDVDTYTHNGSTWLIFTESKQWVIELTEDKTLWYNYNFFKEVFEYTSMDVVENQHYITKWVENNIINKVKHTVTANNHIFDRVEDTIQNGIKETKYNQTFQEPKFQDALQNGVKETSHNATMFQSIYVEDTIQNGVKRTQDNPFSMITNVENAIQNGVKVTITSKLRSNLTAENIIENGVRHTLNTEYMPTSIVQDIIENGVKETKGHGFEQQNIIDDIVKDGVKETKTPGKDGDILSTIEWMEENKTNSVPKMIDDVIENGEKINGTFVGGKRQKENIESVIGYGTKNPSI